MSKFPFFKTQCKNKPNVKDDDWVLLSSGSSSGEEFAQLSIGQVNDRNRNNSNTTTPQLSTSQLPESTSRTRSKTSDGISSLAGCCRSCEATIKDQQKTIHCLVETNQRLSEQLHLFMKKNQSLEEQLSNSGSNIQATQSSQILISNAKLQRPNSDSVLIHMSVEEMNFFSHGMERNNRYPRKRPTSKRRKGFKDPSAAAATFEITVEDEQMNELQSVLCHEIYGEDIFRLFRHFHPIPDQFIADLKKTSDSSCERFHRAFAELKKLGKKKFNPLLIHEYFVQIDHLKYAQTVVPFLSIEDQSEDPNQLPQSS